jgi:hypothetical protein
LNLVAILGTLCITESFYDADAGLQIGAVELLYGFYGHQQNGNNVVGLQLSLDILDMITDAMQAARKSTVDQALHKPWPEASRRKKAHWDFVLEEMAWMANDFMQVSEFFTENIGTL